MVAHISDEELITHSIKQLSDIYPALFTHTPAYLHPALLARPGPMLGDLENDPRIIQVWNSMDSEQTTNFATEDNHILGLWSGGGKGLNFYNGQDLSSLNHDVTNAIKAQMQDDYTVVMMEDTPAGQYAEKLAAIITAYRDRYPECANCIHDSETMIFEEASIHFIRAGNGTLLIAGDDSYALSILRRKEIAEILDNDAYTSIITARVIPGQESFIPARKEPVIVNGVEIPMPDLDALYQTMQYEIDPALEKYAWANSMRQQWFNDTLDELDQTKPAEGQLIDGDSRYAYHVHNMALEILRMGELMTTRSPVPADSAVYAAYIDSVINRLHEQALPRLEDHPMVKKEMETILNNPSRHTDEIRKAYHDNPLARAITQAMELVEHNDTEELTPIYGEDNCFTQRLLAERGTQGPNVTLHDTQPDAQPTPPDIMPR